MKSRFANKLLLTALVLASAFKGHAAENAVDTTILQYVNPFIGTTNFGTTNPGAVRPNALMSVAPFNVTGSDINTYDKDARWWSTPYDNVNSYMTGFSHVNLSGVGCPDLGSLITIATVGPLDVDYHNYGTTVSNETASPGYYAANLDKYGVLAEATSTARTSVERYTFPGGRGNILVNLGIGLTNETGAYIRRVSDTEIVGSRLMGTFCYNPDAVFPMYFAVRVNKKPSSSGFWKMQPEMQGVEAEWTPDNGKYKIYNSYGRDIAGDDIGYWFSYDDLAPNETVEVSVGVSFVSPENAMANLNSEQQGHTFDSILGESRREWAEQLGKIKVEGGSQDQRTIFYTALYHSLIHPNILQDVNGEYPMMESNSDGTTDTNRYTVFSLWDTYRNLHQLLTLVYPEKQLDMVRSMIDIYREWGWLPKWELYGRETFTMEGDPSIPVIVDTWMKGLRGFDIDTAYEAMKKSATTHGAENLMRPDIDPYIERGYIPLGFYQGDNSGDNSVSHALEYYVADNALATLARERGDSAFADTLAGRAAGYRHYYSPESGTLRPINPDGTFLSPFNPRQGENFEAVPGFHEGSAWNYTFFVPHDIEGLVALMGGRKPFVEKLQQVFDQRLYDPANEPDIAYPFIFTHFPGEEHRTDSIVARLIKENFTNNPNGIPGNDDTGAMSAWLVFSMMGLYPDIPGVPEYAVTIPAFDKVTVNLNPEFYSIPQLVIKPSKDRKSVTVNGRKVGRRITHADLIGK